MTETERRIQLARIQLALTTMQPPAEEISYRAIGVGIGIVLMIVVAAIAYAG